MARLERLGVYRMQAKESCLTYENARRYALAAGDDWCTKSIGFSFSRRDSRISKRIRIPALFD